MTTDTLFELFIPALRYYLGRHSIQALRFPHVCMALWDDLSPKDRRVAMRDISDHVEGVRVGDAFAGDADYWREFLRWAKETDEQT